MEGLIKLHQMSTDKKETIINLFESLENFYKKIFLLNHSQYTYSVGSLKNDEKANSIQDKIFSIEFQLQNNGFIDPNSITTDISSDYSEIIILRNKSRFPTYSEFLGEKLFTEMEKWLIQEFNI